MEGVGQEYQTPRHRLTVADKGNKSGSTSFSPTYRNMTDRSSRRSALGESGRGDRRSEVRSRMNDGRDGVVDGSDEEEEEEEEEEERIEVPQGGGFILGDGM